MSFRGVFITVFLGTAMIVAAFMVNARRPASEVDQPTAALVRATGKCAECHRHETSAVVHEFEMSRHSAAGVNCLDCHQPTEGQEPLDHRGFTIAKKLTAANCKQCHPTEYQQFLRSRHAAPAWASVAGHGRLHRRADRLLRAVPQGGGRPPADGDHGDGRAGRGEQGVPEVPRRRQAEQGRLDRHLHRLPRPARRLGRAGPDCPRPAASATWGPTTRSSRSTTSRSTASCSTPRRPT